MIVVIDADYNEEKKSGHVAGIVARATNSEKEEKVITAVVENIGDYIPGQFYKRELKSVEAIISQLNAKDLELIIVDAYADSGTEEHALGTFVYEEYGIPIIGIGKNRYDRCTVKDIEVYRGESQKPLFVTSKGMDNNCAKKIVAEMHGKYRLPWLVKYADQVARNWDL